MNIFTRTNDDDLLKYMDESEREAFSQVNEIITYKRDDIIIKAGARDRDIYIIIKGTVLVTLGEEHTKMTIKLGEQDLLGEINFVLPVRRSATVVASTEVTLLKYDYNKTMEFLAQNLTIAAKFFAALNDVLAMKLVRTTQKQKAHLENNLPD